MHQQSSKRIAVKAPRLDLQAGNPVMIQFPGSPTRHKGIYIGGEAQTYLIIRLLEPENLDPFDRENGKVVAGCVHLGTVLAFETSVLAQIDEPYALLFLAYPPAVHAHRLRSSARVASDIPACARVAGREVRGRVVDLSTSGCRLALRARGAEPGIQPGAAIDLVFILLGGYGEQTVRGQVRTCTLDHGRLEVGIQFDDADPAIKEKIEAYVLSVLAFDQEDVA